MSQNQNPRAPSIPQVFAVAGNRAPAPQAAGQPLQAQHGQSAASDRASRWIPPHLKIAPAPSPNPGMAGQVPPPNTPAATAVGFQGQSHSIPGNLNPSPGPTIIFDMTGRVGGGGHAAPPVSYIAELQRGNVGVNCVWKESALENLAEFELEILRILEEKGRAFWRLWVDLNEPQSEARDRETVMRFVARRLRVYPWFKGDETVAEGMEAVRKIHAIYVEFMSRDRAAAPARFLVASHRLPLGVTATMVSQAQVQARAEGGTHCQAQVKEVGDAEQRCRLW